LTFRNYVSRNSLTSIWRPQNAALGVDAGV